MPRRTCGYLGNVETRRYDYNSEYIDITVGVNQNNVLVNNVRSLYDETICNGSPLKPIDLICEEEAIDFLKKKGYTIFKKVMETE